MCVDVPGIDKSLSGSDFDIQLAWQQFKWHSKRLSKVAAGPAGTNLRHSVTQLHLHYILYYIWSSSCSCSRSCSACSAIKVQSGYLHSVSGELEQLIGEYVSRQ